jgi:hypothetical protein
VAALVPRRVCRRRDDRHPRAAGRCGSRPARARLGDHRPQRGGPVGCARSGAGRRRRTHPPARCHCVPRPGHHSAPPGAGQRPGHATAGRPGDESRDHGGRPGASGPPRRGRRPHRPLRRCEGDRPGAHPRGGLRGVGAGMPAGAGGGGARRWSRRFAAGDATAVAPPPVVAASLQGPATSERVVGGREVLSFAWPEAKVALEYEGRWHGESPQQVDADRRRLNRLTAAGWRVVFVTAADMRHPELIVARLAAALAR